MHAHAWGRDRSPWGNQGSRDTGHDRLQRLQIMMFLAARLALATWWRPIRCRQELDPLELRRYMPGTSVRAWNSDPGPYC